LGFDGAREGIATKRPESHLAQGRRLSCVQREALVVDHDECAAAANHRALLGKVQRHHGDVLAMEVLPDVELGPVGQREDAKTLVGVRDSYRVATAPGAGSWVQ
jgi:hypothetical protein